MPTGQQYATNVPQTTLASGITAVATSFVVASSSNWPATPFTAVLDIGNSIQEPVDVTNVSGTTWTVTRAIDGTTAFAHATNATVTHADIGRDFREARAHIDASSSNDSTGHAVHGLAVGSAVVGTTDAQTLTNKTISAGTFTGAQAMGTGAWTGTGSLTDSTLGASGITGAANSTRLVGATAGGPPTSGTFSTGDHIIDTSLGMVWVCTAGGTPGTWVAGNGRVFLGSLSLTGASNSVTSFSLPATAANFRNLEMDYNLQCSGSGPTGPTQVFMGVNGIVTASYNWTRITFNNGGTLGTAGADGATSTAMGLAWNSSTGAPTNGQGVGTININGFNNTTFKHAWEGKSGGGDGTTSNTQMVSTFSGSVNSTAAITSLSFFTGIAATWTSGSVINFYGVV